jgi:hypothetical protein
MSPRTLTEPPTSRVMWRRLLRATHPDAADGSHDLFIWTKSVFEHVSGTSIPEDPPRSRRDPPRHPQPSGDRVPFEDAAPFADLTHKALRLAESGAIEEPYATLLGLLGDCLEVGPDDPMQWRQQGQGATYRSLAALAYRANMSKMERVQWYRIAESIPLSQRHVGHLMARLQA